MSATLSGMRNLAADVARLQVGSEMSRPLIEELCGDCGVDTVVAFLVECQRTNDWNCTLQIAWANETRPEGEEA